MLNNLFTKSVSQENLTAQLEEAFDMYADALHKHAYFRVNNGEQAQDLVQDTFMKCWDYAKRQAESGKPIKNWRAVLYRSLNNLIIDYYRKHKSSSLDELLERDGVSDGTFDELHSNATQGTTTVSELRKQIAILGEPDTTIVIMRIIDGFPTKEVAKQLNISTSAVDTKLHRAKKKLKEIL